MPAKRKKKPSRSVEERNRLVLDNMGLIRMLAIKARYRPRVAASIDEEDAIQEGVVAALRAAEHWDEGRKVKFGTYMGEAVKHEVPKAAIHTALIRLNPTLATVIDLLRSNERPRYSNSNYTNAYHLHRRANNATALQEYEEWQAPETVDSHDELERDEEIAVLNRAMDRIDPRQRYVIEQRYYHGRLLKDIGVDLDVSMERTRQIFYTGISRLREILQGLA